MFEPFNTFYEILHTITNHHMDWYWYWFIDTIFMGTAQIVRILEWYKKDNVKRVYKCKNDVVARCLKLQPFNVSWL